MNFRLFYVNYVKRFPLMEIKREILMEKNNFSFFFFFFMLKNIYFFFFAMKCFKLCLFPYGGLKCFEDYRTVNRIFHKITYWCKGWKSFSQKLVSLFLPYFTYSHVINRSLINYWKFHQPRSLFIPHINTLAWVIRKNRSGHQSGRIRMRSDQNMGRSYAIL